MTTHSGLHSEDFRSGHELSIDHRKLGMWLFLASEVMFFGGLIGTYLHYKATLPSPEAAALDPVLVGINTFVLLTSSLMVVLGLESIRQGNRRGLVTFLGLTALLGAAFLGGQAYEFAHLAAAGITLTSSVFGSSFFTLTGFHGLHVLIGVAWALLTLGKAARGQYSAVENMGVEAFGLYWHFVDIVWIVLFTIIYLV
jgi:heme/copper-type cytochrome/quinol oxidase subunit 3